MQKHEEKTCPRCNQKFECKPVNITHCQCYEVNLADAERLRIENNYSDCLCINCLKSIREGAKK